MFFPRFTNIRVFALAAMCSVFVFSSGAAQALQCPMKMPNISVRSTTTKLEKIDTISTGGLTRLHSGSYRPGASNILGLGGGSFALEAAIQFEIEEHGALSCVGVKAIRGKFSIQPVVMVARNYPEGSCEYKAVLEHEMRHVRILREFQNRYAARFNQKLMKIAGEHRRSLVTSSVNNNWQKEQIKRDIQAQVEQYADEIKDVLMLRQKELDSAKEYARVSEKCKNW